MAFAIRNRRGARVGARRGQRFATRPTPARSFQQYANSGAQVFFFASFFALPAISFLMRFTEAPETNMSIELSPPWSLRARFHEWTDDSSDKPSRLSSPSSVMWIILTMVTSRHSVRQGIISYASALTYLRNVRFWHLADMLLARTDVCFQALNTPLCPLMTHNRHGERGPSRLGGLV